VLAARYERTGGAHEVLLVAEVDRPDPGPGEVLVRIRVSGVNPTDWKARAGSTRRELGGPLQASDELGASLGIPALTAHRCLFADGPIDGLTVLVAGGAGAVGHSAIELARWAGARVIATTSTDEKAALAAGAGAAEVVNYRQEDAARRVRAAAPDGVDRVVEVAPAPNLELDLTVCAPHAVIASYATDGGDELVVPVGRVMAPNLVFRFVLVYTMPTTALRRAVDAVTDALRDGALTTLPLHRFPLQRAADAHNAVEAGAVGKVLIDLP
jgi:NADPH2:quinone reductase